MRKLALALCMTVVPLVYAGTPANAADMVYKAPPAAVAEPARPGPSHYYPDWYDWGFHSGYGPFADCNGTRCYVGPPTNRRYGTYYYGPRGGYYRDYSHWTPVGWR